jgi:hypothetical protein
VPVFLLVLTLLPNIGRAQDQRLVDGEKTICRLTVSRPANGDKTNSNPSKQKVVPVLVPTVISPDLNQIGYFDRVADINPNESVQVELTYPDAKIGDQIVVSVEDGGMIEKEQKVGVYHLDKSRKITCTFKVGQAPGLYRLAVRKDFETRLVQLWVGPEPAPLQN